MKTLKRTLCLVLALVMVVGVLAIGSSAAFTDDDKIQYEVPVGVMVGMGIIDGYTDGSFQPAKTVNRAEAAKMICYALIGTAAADGLVCTEKPFADVAVNDWFAPYVSYLKTKGVIDGYDDGLFHGGYPVTGLQLAKMLLVAAGYGQQGEYTESGFATNTYVDALSKGTKSIFNGTKATDLTAAATREEAALYIYNAMCYIQQVLFSAGSQILGIAPSYTLKGATMAAEKFGYRAEDYNTSAGTVAKTVATGYIVANSATNTALAASATDKTIVERTNLVAAIADGAAQTSYKFQSGLDMLGHKVKVYFGTDNKVFYVEDLSTVTADVTVGSSTFTAAELKKLGFTNTAALTTANTITGYATMAAGAGVPGTTGATATLISNNDGKTVDTIVMTQAKTLSKVTAYKAPTATAAGSVTITGLTAAGAVGATAAIALEKIGSDTKDVVSLYEGIKANDYVYVTKVGNTVAKVEAATVVTNTMSYYSEKAVTVGGTSYGFVSAMNAYLSTNNTNLAGLGLATVAAGQVSGSTMYNFVLLANGKLAGCTAFDASASAKDYAVVLSAGTTAAKPASVTNGFVQTDATAVLYVALSDGTKATYNLNLTKAQKAYTAANDLNGLIAAYTAGTIIKYSVNGTTFSSIKSMEAEDFTGTVTKGSVLTGVNAKYYTANTAFVYWLHTDVTDFKVTAATGYASAKTSSTANSVKFIAAANGEVIFAYVDLAGGAEAAKNIIYLASESYATGIDANGDALYIYNGYVDGVATQLKSKSAITIDKAKTNAAKLYEYETADGYVTSITMLDTATAVNKVSAASTISYVDANQLVFDGVAYTYANAKVVTVANAANNNTVALGSAAVSVDGYNTYIVLKTAANGTTLADIAYIYVIQA